MAHESPISALKLTPRFFARSIYMGASLGWYLGFAVRGLRLLRAFATVHLVLVGVFVAIGAGAVALLPWAAWWAVEHHRDVRSAKAGDILLEG